MTSWQVIEADCVEAMRGMPDASVHAVVCDPPYDLTSGKRGGSGTASVDLDSPYGRARIGAGNGPGGFMGKAWDGTGVAFDSATWREALRVLRPGGHLLAFGGTRTYHRLACAIEDAGFEIRDETLSMFEATEVGQQFLVSLSPAQLAALDKLGGGPLAWLYASGFPKSLSVGKTLDAEAAALARQWMLAPYGSPMAEAHRDWLEAEMPRRVEAREEHGGFGTALKPAHEPIVLARKPLSGTVAATVLQHGTGALNIDGCRIAGRERTDYGLTNARRTRSATYGEPSGSADFDSMAGRWPANVALSHSDGCRQAGTRRVKGSPKPYVRSVDVDGGVTGWNAERAGQEVPGYADADGMETVPAWECVENCAVRMLDEQTGALSINRPAHYRESGTGAASCLYGDGMGHRAPGSERSGFGDSGGASRFFYCAKSSSAERNAGLDGFEARTAGNFEDDAYQWPTDGHGNPRSRPIVKRNTHPTVKPIELMRWLVRLVGCQPGSTILDPFAGSGTTGIACVLEGFNFVGIEREPEYAEIARARIAWWEQHPEGVEIVKALEADRVRKCVAKTGQLGMFDGGTVE